MHFMGRLRLKCDGTHVETRFHLSAKRTSSFKSAGASVRSPAGSQGVRISGSNAGYTMFRSSVKGTGYPLHSPVSPSIPLPCVTVCHYVSTGLYLQNVFTEALRCNAQSRQMNLIPVQTLHATVLPTHAPLIKPFNLHLYTT